MCEECLPMYPPVDYPVNDDSSNGDSVGDDMTYAALLDRHESDEVITEAMIESACLRIEMAQQFPFACKPELSTAKALSRWIRVIS